MLIPIKSFDLAKERLGSALSAPERSQLAKEMAGRVIRAATPLPVWVVCHDSAVAAFAAANGAGIIWRAPRGLNAAVSDGRSFLRRSGFSRLVIAHGDLPLARSLAWTADGPGVTIVPDRRDDGTNVMSVPSGVEFRFFYGPGSAAAHVAEAERLGLEVRVVPDDELGWDVDVPEDLGVFDRGALT